MQSKPEQKEDDPMQTTPCHGDVCSSMILAAMSRPNLKAALSEALDVSG
jgi:hypothetical protein